MTTVKKLLIANRGEIACRILRTARAMGIECAAVHSDADTHAPHVQLADVAFAIGPPESRDSYLNIERIVDVARNWQADAIHPGYGFLSENADFAEAVTRAGMRFVGPDAHAIRDMGSKSRAKALMAAAKVPLLPGYHGDEQDAEHLRREAAAIGYPLLIKAVAGGGGRGLRVVEADAEFDEALRAVRREAASAFGDDRVLLEKYLTDARHVEVQVFADRHGNCVHLYDRDCSVQRRHQKLLEEAPAPGLDPDLRKAMADAAVRAALAIDYCGAGTVEFLVADGEFHFLEMNTRLQVEHPVTEAVTGQDLVEWQLRVASGETLPLQQDEIHCRGWAIEARVNAEEPEQDFRPATGCINSLHWAPVPGLRVDSGVRQGSRISVYYDSMIAKVIARGDNRAQAIEALAAALQHSSLEGIAHNMSFLEAVLAQPAFRSGELETGFLNTHAAGIATSLHRIQQRQALQPVSPNTDPGLSSLHAFRSPGHNAFSRRYHLEGQASPAHVAGEAGSAVLRSDALHAPLPGRVLEVAVQAGESVKEGQVLLILDAMKMEHSLRAESDAVIAELHCQADDLVEPDQLLLLFANTDADGSGAQT